MLARMTSLFIAFAAAALVAAPAQPATPITMAKITATCQSCHGVGGNSHLRNVPRLNGQIANYIAQRLTAFLDPTKQTTNAIHAMWGISTTVGREDIPQIARYYADQQATPRAHRKSRLTREGAALFAQGGEGIPACNACHGAHGEGTNKAPRLAGQHGDYLSYQMTAFVVTMNTHPTMDHPKMTLDQTQIDALAAYLGKD
jgi:cytochrome c553